MAEIRIGISKTNIMNTQINTSRIQAVDWARGLVMVLMAIDHVRVYSGLPAGGVEPGIFFTRWVTHFCAPAFVFLSGTSAFLYGTKLNDIKKLSAYLLSRGLLLVVLELTVIRFFWTFNFNYGQFTLAGVIWMLGWCMIALALLVRLKAKVIGVLGLGIIFLQQLFAAVPLILPESIRPIFGFAWEFIYSSGLQGPPGITILYVLVPWIGVMAAGYGFGLLLQLEESKRKRILVWVGAIATGLFLITAIIFALISRNPKMPFVFQVLNQQKYPASQLFLLMTLGPVILMMPFVERWTDKISNALKLFGRVPFFYYLLHIPLIHLSALAVQLILFGALKTGPYDTAPYTWMEEPDRWSLGVLYLVFALNVIILYLACKWYDRFKFQHPEKRWLKFL